MRSYPPRIALSVDIEDWCHSRHVSSLHPDPNGDVQRFFLDHDEGRDLLTAPVQILLELFRADNLRATFFLVAGLAERYAPLFRAIAQAGHEIACHGLNHVEYRGQGEAAEMALFHSDTLAAKAMLEGICKVPVTGYRAPSAYVRGWMVPQLIELGFRYDSSVSVNTLYNKTDSSLCGITTAPYRMGGNGLLPDPAGRLLELPWPYLNVCGFRLPTAGGPALRLAGLLPIRLGLDQSLVRGDTVLYIHPLDITDVPMPDVIMRNRRRFWRNRGPTTLRRFTSLLRRYKNQYATCGEIAEKNLRGE